MSVRFGQIVNAYRHNIPVGHRAKLLYHASIALIPILICSCFAWGISAAGWRALGALLLELFFSVSLA